MASITPDRSKRFAAMFLFLAVVFVALILGARKLEEMFYLDGHKPNVATLYRMDGPVADGGVAGVPAEPGTKHLALSDVAVTKVGVLSPGDRVRLPIPGEHDMRGRVNRTSNVGGEQVLEGQLERGGGTFRFAVRDGRLTGRVVPAEGPVAYQIASAEDGKTYLVERRKEAVVSAE